MSELQRSFWIKSQGVQGFGEVKEWNSEAIAKANCPQLARGMGVKAPQSELWYPKPRDLGVGRVKPDNCSVEARSGSV